MKKLFILILLVGFGTSIITSCGNSKKEEAQEGTADVYDEYETAEPKEASEEELIAQGKAMVDASDCKTCHHATNKIVGPAHAEVAKKYEFTRANVSMLSDKIINGGAGNWGDIPMTAHTDLSRADAERMAMYVLSLDGEKLKD